MIKIMVLEMPKNIECQLNGDLNNYFSSKVARLCAVHLYSLVLLHHYGVRNCVFSIFKSIKLLFLLRLFEFGERFKG